MSLYEYITICAVIDQLDCTTALLWPLLKPLLKKSTEGRKIKGPHLLPPLIWASLRGCAATKECKKFKFQPLAPESWPGLPHDLCSQTAKDKRRQAGQEQPTSEGFKNPCWHWERHTKRKRNALCRFRWPLGRDSSGMFITLFLYTHGVSHYKKGGFFFFFLKISFAKKLFLSSLEVVFTDVKKI